MTLACIPCFDSFFALSIVLLMAIFTRSRKNDGEETNEVNPPSESDQRQSI